LVLVVRLKQ
jgi:hypothetical protein